MLDEVLKTIQKHHPSLGKAGPSSDLWDDLGLDSLDFAGIIVDLEDQCGVEFDGENLPPIKTVEDLAHHIQNLLKEKNSHEYHSIKRRLGS